MKNTNHETKNPFAIFPLQGGRLRARGSGVVHHASFLTGMALAVVLGSMFALSTPAFAMGGGGGGGGSAPAPKVTKVDDPVAKPKDEFAEVKKPVVEHGDKTPVVGELKTKEPKEEKLAIEDSDEDKTETKPDEKTAEFPKPKTVEAAVGFAESSSRVAENGGVLQIQVQIDEPLSRPVALLVGVDGTAIHGKDYAISSRIITIPANATSASLTLTGIDDDVDEADETVTLTLRGKLLPEGVTVDVKSTHTVTIVDDDVASEIEVVEKPEEETPEVAVKPDDDAGDDETADTGGETGAEVDTNPDVITATIGFEAESSEMIENGGVLQIQVQIDEPLSRPVTLLVGADGTAIHGKDYAISSRIITIPANATSASLTLTGIDDDVDEADETVTLTLRGKLLPEGVTVDVKSIHTVTIVDDDVAGEIEKETTEDETEGETSEKLRAIRIRRRGEISIVNREHVAAINAVQDYLTKGSTEESDISIVNYGNISGVTFAKHRANTNGDILIENHGTADGIFTEYKGNVGDVSIENHGTARTVSVGYDGNIGDISIENHETVTFDVGVRYGKTRHYGPDGGIGDVSIENRGTVGRNMEVKHDGEGGIGIASHGTVGRGIKVEHDGEGVVEVTNYGTVGRDMEVKHDGEGGIGITNHGTVGQVEVWPYGSDIRAWHDGDGVVEVTNYGTVGRDIEVEHSGRGNVLIENRGEIGREISARHDGDGDVLIANHGTGSVNVYHYGDGVVRFEGNINESGEHWLQGETIRLGNIDFKGSEKGGYSELIIVGGYEGSSDTQLNFHVGPDKDFGKLWVGGDVTGQSRVSLVVEDASFITESTNFPEMIFAEGEYDVKADSFIGEQTVGAFNYVLEYNVLEGVYNDKDYAWSFVNRGLSDTAVKTSKIADEVSDSIETPPTNNPDKKTELGLWGEQNGSHTAIGLNALATRLMGGDMVVGTSMSRNFSTSNNVNVGSQITALTANWERNGFYAVGQTRYASFTSDVSTDRLSVVQGNEGTGVNASVDLGYRFAFPFGGMDFQVAPQMQLVWSRVNFDDFIGPHGERVSLEDGDLTTGRLGLSWDGEWRGAEGFGRIYGGMNLRGAVDGKTSVNVSGVSIANEQKGLSVDGNLGLSYEWNEGYAVYGEASAMRHEDVEEIRANLGVRIDF